jgi:hypothetical protein
LLPESTQRRLEEVCPNGIIPVSPIPSNIDDLKNITDLRTLFTRSHVQYLHTRYFSKQRNTKEGEKHIFWSQLHNVQFDNMPKAEQGMGKTINTAVQDFGINLENMYIGNGLFAKCFDRLLLVYLRIHLAPKREASHIEMVTRMAKIKKERQHMTTKENASERRRQLKREAKYEKKCLTKAEHADSDNDKEKWSHRGKLSKQRRDELYQKHKQKIADNNSSQSLPSSANSENHINKTPLLFDEMDDSDSDDSDDDNSDYVDESGRKENVEKVDNSDTIPKDVKAKEPPRKRINMLKAVAKGLLQQEDLPSEIDEETIDRVCQKRQDLSEFEKKALVRLYNTLRPFVPPSTAPRWPVLLLPIIMISNIVQRVAGYSQFARDFCPDVRPSHLHSMKLDALAIYELFGSRQANFVLLDEQNQIISSDVRALRNKSTVFQAFFNLQAVKSVCVDHGIEFQDILTVKPNGLTRLFGQLQEKVRPSTSSYDSARKDSFRSQGNAEPLSTRERQSVESEIPIIDASIASLDKDLKQKAKIMRQSERAVQKTKAAIKKPQGIERQDLYELLKEQKLERDKHRVAVLKLKQSVKDERQHRYWLVKVSTFVSQNINALNSN